MIEPNKRPARARLRYAVVAGLVTMIGAAGTPAWAAESAPVTLEPAVACELPAVDSSSRPALAAAGTTALIADTTTVYDVTVPENIPQDKIIKCGEVELMWMYYEGGGVYIFRTTPRIDATKCKAKLELLDKDGKVKETWETNQPEQPGDRLWIGTLFGNLYFEKGKPGTYRVTVVCTP